MHPQHLVRHERDSIFDLMDLIRSKNQFLLLDDLSGQGDSPFGPEKVTDFTAVVCFLIMHPQRLVGIKETLSSTWRT